MAIQQVVSELNRIQAVGLISAYAIGGAVAAQAYIESSSTVDVDVFVVFGGAGAHSLAPLTPIYSDLTSHGARADGQYLVIGDWPVQLLPSVSPLYNDAIASARTMNFGDQPGRIMGPEHLAAIALATGRDKDYARVEQFLKSGATDLAALTALVERFDLRERWETFKRRYPTTNA